MQDLISVIIPSYNSELYIRGCLESILQNTYKNVEVIIVDDGSTDNSNFIYNSIIEQHSNVFVYWQKNSGPSAARNVGISHAKGKYIVFVDSDDYIDKCYLEKLHSMISTGNVAVAQVSYKRFYDAVNHCENEIYHDSLLPVDSALNTVWSGGLLDGYVWDKIFKTDTIKSNNLLFFTETSIWEDSLFVIEYLAKSNGYCLVRNEPLYFYRINRESVTSKKVSSIQARGKLLAIKRLHHVLNLDSFPSLAKASRIASYNSLVELLKTTTITHSELKEYQHTIGRINIIKLIHIYLLIFRFKKRQTNDN